MRAFTQLFNRYDKRIYPYVLKMVDSETVAEEITQEVFIRLWSSRDKLRTVENPEAYILTTAVNHTIRVVKKTLNERRSLQKLAGMVNDAATNDTELQMDLKESAQLVREAVKRLPERQRQVFELSRNEGMDYDAIAIELNISRNTVRNHLVEALKSIRQHLEQQKNPGHSLMLCILLTAYT